MVVHGQLFTANRLCSSFHVNTKDMLEIILISNSITGHTHQVWIASYMIKTVQIAVID